MKLKELGQNQCVSDAVSSGCSCII